MHFLDKAKIYIKAGDGGNGCISFRREKFIEFGGPNGGNGGRGASVYFRTDPALNTLIDFRYRQHFKAENGQPGKGKNLSGAAGKNLEIVVPVGTIIWNSDKTQKLFELNSPNERVLFLKGGEGGKGNAHFKSSTNQAPKFAQSGTKGDEIWVWLELNLFADVGLIGFPNAGKSTLLTHISNSKAKIADYAFSTLVPNLGVASSYGYSFVVADIPGLIEGAHTGKALGSHFLSHIKKCNLLLHLIDASQESYLKAYSCINQELDLYSEELGKKPQMVVITKIDTITEEELHQKLSIFKAALVKGTHQPAEVLTISSTQQLNVDTLLAKVATKLKSLHSQTCSYTEVKSWSPLDQL